MTTMTFEDAVARIIAARSFQDLAEAKNAETGTSTGNSAGRAYRKWAKLIHPDTVSAQRRATATDAFAKLSALYENRKKRIEPWGSGDIAELFADGDRLIKMPRNPADNDLMETEAAALRKLWADGDPRFRPYAPRLIETFVHEDEQRRRRVVNVLERRRGMGTLAEVEGDLGVREAAWIWRRLLVAIGWAHRAGVTHGAVLPEHVLIHPGRRGLVLVDWCYAGHRPAAIVRARVDHYPPEVRDDRTAGPATDIYMATVLMTRLMGSRMPASLRRFAAGCTYDAPRMRPQDAWALLGEFDDIIPPQYRN
ncbi:molecular chaperone DnaJ [Actinoplanes sp. CA-252034]|uniref:molecular chaperone DnaJ n=1 Tax=Actinoplanes sp. CA-252034 TaxID=3239906 RepID=UPI003D96D65C